MRKLERSVEKAFVRKCKRLKVMQIKVGINSLPDRLAIVPEGVVWIEFKRPGEILRKNQERKVNRLRKLGQRVEVIDNSPDARALALELSLE